MSNRWLKDSEVTIGSERKMRRSSSTSSGVASEALLFSFPLKRGREEMHPVPLCYAPDLLEDELSSARTEKNLPQAVVTTTLGSSMTCTNKQQM